METNVRFTNKFSTTKTAPIKNIKEVFPEICADSSSCEINIQIGIFFDGTGNNKDVDKSKMGHSNVARLFDAYTEDAKAGCSKIYLPGLGTPFPQIAEHAETTFGAAFGRGGEGRILYAMLSLCNLICGVGLGKRILAPYELEVLCKDAEVSEDERYILGNFGLYTRLAGASSEIRKHFFDEQQEKIQEMYAKEHVPLPKECLLDVFGFSRGAAESRVFCHWLAELFKSGKFASIPIRFRFLGLLDTVASIGVWDMARNAMFGKSGGHGSWARSSHLRILPEVENCVHLVAMHELRKNFPLESISVGDELPPNCVEFAYPGTHSDVGGGYRPGDLGNSIGATERDGDALKLSQIPLNHMYDCAKAAGVPISRVNQSGARDFMIAPEVEMAFNRFLDLSTDSPRLLSDWVLPYLAWRWQQRSKYESLSHVGRSPLKQRAYLLGANIVFEEEGQRMAMFGDLPKSMEYVAKARSDPNFNANNAEFRQEQFSALEPEAVEVLSRVRMVPSVSPELGEFFDKFVHDSVAGFWEKLAEATGHWKYRRIYRGSDNPLLS